LSWNALYTAYRYFAVLDTGPYLINSQVMTLKITHGDLRLFDY
ncbi:unnamed protein product, partial [marine sediment metagenome]